MKDKTYFKPEIDMTTSKNTFTVHSLKMLLLLMTMLFCFSPNLLALDLDTALSKGLAGEVDNGYLEIPPGAGNEAGSLVNSVNTKRRAAYAEIAKKNGVTPEVAGQATFEKRYPGFPAQTWVKIQDRWMQK